MTNKYSHILEERLKVGSAIDRLAAEFDRQGYNQATTDLGLLRNIKLFLADNSESRTEIVRGSRLDSTDCLSIAVMANTLAARNGVDTRIARPKKLSRYLHAMLVYNLENPRVFKLTGSNNLYEPEILSPDQVIFRLNYIRPFVNLVNSVKGRDYYSRKDCCENC